MTRMKIVGAANWYRTERLAHDVTLIEEPHIKPFYRCNMWHVQAVGRRFFSGLTLLAVRPAVGENMPGTSRNSRRLPGSSCGAAAEQGFVRRLLPWAATAPST
jgi:hypothetical protein